MGDEFKLPGSSYDELVKIIRAYGHAGPDATPEEVGKLAGMHPTQVSRNNGFLVGIGAIEGGRKKSITDKGKHLAHALDHTMLDEIIENWRSIVVGNDFLSKLLTAVRIRQGMDSPTLQAHVAYSAGQPKSRTVMTGAAAVVDILKASGTLREQDGKLVAVDPGDEPARIESAGKLDLRDQVTVRFGDSATVTRQDLAHSRPTVTSSAPGPSVSIQIQIQCNASEVEQLGPKLRQLLAELSRTIPESASSTD